MQTYCIRVNEQLDYSWSGWLDNAMLAHSADGSTQIVTHVPDQAALYGLLIRLRDLGCTLLTVERSD